MQMYQGRMPGDDQATAGGSNIGLTDRSSNLVDLSEIDIDLFNRLLKTNKRIGSIILKHDV